MSFFEGFKNPDALYRPAPLWVWNDIITREEIKYQLSELASHGFGGAFVHPRPGLVTGYLSEEWFDLWEYALECANKLGIKLYIYDENSYPSGFAGGHVSALCPDGISSYADLIVSDTPEGVRTAEQRLTVIAVKDDNGRFYDAVNVTAQPEDKWKDYGDKFIAVYIKPQTPAGWNAGFAYVDLMRPEVHEAFMQTTYERYYDRFGKYFGTSIPAIFTDEPSVGTGIAPFSFWFANQFRRLKGYDIIKNLPLIFRDIEGDCFDRSAEKVRFDYYDTIHELYVKNWIEASGEWCEKHNIRFTGHYLEHQWPLVRENVSPAMQSYYEYHQWPAIDMLFTNYLKDAPTHSLTHTIRELRSASDQFGKERALCELYGAGGWDSTFDDYKRMADWVLVNGVNFINQHLTYSTIAGARKHDHPQSFDWRQSWWNEYTEMNDYIGRVQWMLTRGKAEQRILVLNPSTTGYTVGALDAAGSMLSDGSAECIKNPDMTLFLTLCQMLTDEQWDYDLGDEYILQRHAKAENGKLNVVKQNYSVVIVSGSMKNMLSSTFRLLCDAVNAGVTVIAVGAPGKLIDGEKNEEAYETLEMMWQKTDIDCVGALLEKTICRRITADIPFPPGFVHLRRELENKDTVWFFVNHSAQTFKANITVSGKSVKELKLYSGDISDIEYFAKENGRIEIPLELVRNQSLLIHVSAAQGIPPIRRVYDFTTETPEPSFVTMRDDNVFPIMYCDYVSEYGEEKDGYVISLCDRIFRERGFSSNPWDCKVQYRKNIIEHDKDYDKHSGFKLIYRFTAAEGFSPDKLELCAEHPEYCNLKVNGKPVKWIEGKTWLDRHIGVANVKDALMCGENVAEITVPVFHTFYEADAIYLKGDFDVTDKNGKWVLDNQSNLKTGSWKTQGKPFYHGCVDYAYNVVIDDNFGLVLLDADWNGTALSVTVNGEYAGLMHADGKREKDITEHIKKGVNEIVLHVCGNYKNLLGPHFIQVRNFAGPGMWHVSPSHTPDAEQFDLVDVGLTGIRIKTAKTRRSE